MARRNSQLNLADRRRLFHFVERKLPIKEMARELGRHRSTIYREIRRKTFHDRELPDYSGYFPTVADEIRKERRQRLRKLVRHPQLRELVIEQLKAVRATDRRSSARRWRERRAGLHRDDLSLHLRQGRSGAGALSASGGRPPQTPPPRLEETPRRHFSCCLQDITTS